VIFARWSVAVSSADGEHGTILGVQGWNSRRVGDEADDVDGEGNESGLDGDETISRYVVLLGMYRGWTWTSIGDGFDEDVAVGFETSNKEDCGWYSSMMLFVAWAN